MTDRRFYEELYAKLVPERQEDVPAAPGPLEEEDDEGARAHLHVTVGEEHLALPVGIIEEVVAEPSVTPVPRSHPAILGVILHRGALVPLLQTSYLLGEPLAATAPPLLGRVVVMSVKGNLLALPVTQTRGVVEIPEDAWQDLPRETFRHVRRAARIPEGLIGLLPLEDLEGILEER